MPSLILIIHVTIQLITVITLVYIIAVSFSNLESLWNFAGIKNNLTSVSLPEFPKFSLCYQFHIWWFCPLHIYMMGVPSRYESKKWTHWWLSEWLLWDQLKLKVVTEVKSTFYVKWSAVYSIWNVVLQLVMILMFSTHINYIDISWQQMVMCHQYFASINWLQLWFIHTLSVPWLM
jgi:hypothetical protein